MPILEGLRAYLAWWVVVCHVLAECGFEAHFLPGVLKVLRGAGGEAVDVFIILSGFVITLVLTAKDEPFRRFIARRWFRIYPVFALSILVGAVAFESITALRGYINAEFHAEPLYTPIWDEAWRAHFPAYMLSSLSLLHGAMPNVWLPHAYAAFNSPGWSISLEWQFYLVVPFVLAAYRLRPVITLATAAGLTLVLAPLDIGGWGSFLPQHAEWFAAGMVSYFVYRRIVDTPSITAPFTPLVLFLLWVAIPELRAMTTFSYDFSPGLWLPLSIWAVALALALDCQRGRGGRLVRGLVWLFENRLVTYLGQVSYSTYLWHYFAVYLGFALYQKTGLAGGKYQALAVVGVLTTGFTLGLSALSYHFVERPGMAWGNRWLGGGKKRGAINVVDGVPRASCG